MNAYVNNAAVATPEVESKSVGIQKKDTFKGVFPIRLAATNNAKNKPARIHSAGAEKTVTKTSSPIAFAPLICLKTGHKTTTQARKIAANPLRMTLM